MSPTHPALTSRSHSFASLPAAGVFLLALALTLCASVSPAADYEALLEDWTPGGEAIEGQSTEADQQPSLAGPVLISDASGSDELLLETPPGNDTPAPAPPGDHACQACQAAPRATCQSCEQQMLYGCGGPGGGGACRGGCGRHSDCGQLLSPHDCLDNGHKRLGISECGPRQAPCLPSSAFYDYFRSRRAYSNVWAGYAEETRTRCRNIDPHLHGRWQRQSYDPYERGRLIAPNRGCPDCH